MENKKIFISGVTGFIGKYLAFKLAEKNQVSALIRPESKNKIIELQKMKVKIIFGDLLDNDSYSEILNSVDYVFHLAALFKLEAPKDDLYKCNVIGTKKILEACIGQQNIKRIIYFSTAYVSGVIEKEFITEKEPYPNRFKNWYEWSKAESEKVASHFLKEYDLPITIVRPVIVYGHGSFYGFYTALKLISDGRLFMLPGSGRNKVHLVHVEDVVNAAIYLAERKDTIGEIYHICDDRVYTCNELMKMLCKELKIKPPPFRLPRFLIKSLIKIPFCKFFLNGISPQLLDYFLYSQSYDNKKLKSAGYFLKYPTLENGLKPVIDWYRKSNYFGKRSGCV